MPSILLPKRPQAPAAIGPAHLRADFLDQLLLVLPTLAAAGYFLVRGWLNALTVVGGVVALAALISHRDDARSLLRQRQVRWIVLALAAPLAAVLATALAHQQLVPRYLDGPIRYLFAGLLMLGLAARRLDFGPLAGPSFAVGLLLCGGMFLLPTAPLFFWGDRLASYFIDPIVLSQHTMIGAFVCLYSLRRREPLWLRALKLAGAAAAVAVSVRTGSRTGWTMAPLLLVLWLLKARGGATARTVAASVALVALACFAVYFASSTVHVRINDAVNDVRQYAAGTFLDSSVGIRISLYRANWIFFLQHPWFGWGHSTLPDVKTVPAIAAFYSPLFETNFVGAGGHNEFLQAMMRMGSVGLASRLLLFLVPLWVFVAAVRSGDPARRQNGYYGLVLVIGYLTASITPETTNLIHAASFYAQFVAVFAAGALAREPA
ncbi:O-antigen ligase family protein [Ramlibacter humi]|uniref:O-antigen ligase family protein n=1 Tax=Ramlibacter humi TaxID=2530451 RepID=A0A4Z0CAX8_9BURK|nr:O-antigen ligase family protein [Ramlibacter humi]TFZ08164.1 O-antigen ligase family protein [Ramlibacter humi]